jgi:hypothetical protein
MEYRWQARGEFGTVALRGHQAMRERIAALEQYPSSVSLLFEDEANPAARFLPPEFEFALVF